LREETGTLTINPGSKPGKPQSEVESDTHSAPRFTNDDEESSNDGEMVSEGLGRTKAASVVRSRVKKGGNTLGEGDEIDEDDVEKSPFFFLDGGSGDSEENDEGYESPFCDHSWYLRVSFWQFRFLARRRWGWYGIYFGDMALLVSLVTEAILIHGYDDHSIDPYHGTATKMGFSSFSAILGSIMCAFAVSMLHLMMHNQSLRTLDRILRSVAMLKAGGSKHALSDASPRSFEDEKVATLCLAKSCDSRYSKIVRFLFWFCFVAGLLILGNIMFDIVGLLSSTDTMNTVSHSIKIANGVSWLFSWMLILPSFTGIIWFMLVFPVVMRTGICEYLEAWRVAIHVCARKLDSMSSPTADVCDHVQTRVRRLNDVQQDLVLSLGRFSKENGAYTAVLYLLLGAVTLVFYLLLFLMIRHGLCLEFPVHFCAVLFSFCLCASCFVQGLINMASVYETYDLRSKYIFGGPKCWAVSLHVTGDSRNLRLEMDDVGDLMSFRLAGMRVTNAMVYKIVVSVFGVFVLSMLLPLVNH